MFAKKKLDAEGKSDARADQKLLIFFVWPNASIGYQEGLIGMSL